MKELMIFEGKQVEVFELDGTVFFNPYHVGNCLGLTGSAVRKAISNMNENQVIKLTNSDVKESNIRKLNNAGENFLAESGVYKLVFRSNKPKAEKFTDWVTDEVLPTIRKEGKYDIDVKEVNSNQNSIQIEKEKLDKAVTTSNYLINYISSANTKIPNQILDSLTTSIQAVHIDIIDHLKIINNCRR